MRRLLYVLLVTIIALSGCRASEVRTLFCGGETANSSPEVGGHANADSASSANDSVGVRSAYSRHRGAENPAVRSGIQAASPEVLPTATFESPVAAEQAAVEIILPSVLYLVTGEHYQLEFAKFIKGFEGGSNAVTITGPDSGSESFADKWVFTPTDDGSFTLSVTVTDSSGAMVASVTRPVRIFSPPSGDRLLHLSVGDSITRAGAYAEIAVKCILGGKLVGTRTYDRGFLNIEGRGGWTVDRYVTRIGKLTGGDSPFLFPAGVNGKRYRGNTSFWKSVTVGDPKGYDYEGFQLIARDWKAENPFLFDADGYPTSAESGDVIVDPELELGSHWREYDGFRWKAMDPQPDVEISFEKYLDRYTAAFSAGRPTSISIMLGTVDFLSALTEASWSTFRAGLDSLIASIRAWDPMVPIILIGSPSGGPPSKWIDKQMNGADFDNRMIENSRRLYSTYDRPEVRAKRVYVMSFLGVISDDNMSDFVHPTVPQGHSQMAPWLAGMLSYLITQGSI